MARGLQLAMRKAAEEQREAAIQEAFKKAKVSQTRFSSVFFLTPFGNLRRKCRKLAESPQAWTVLHRLLRFRSQWVNDLDSWKPKGKAVNTLLRSLIRHLICKYPMPAFWFEVWFRGTENMHRFRGGGAAFQDMPIYATLCDLFVQIAQGTSMAKLAKQGAFPVNLTKKQCHAFMQQRKVSSVVHAVRWTQVQSFGGDRPLAEALCATNWGDQFGHQLEEDFRSTVIQWFAAQAMLDMTQVGPLIDYIEHCRRENAQWAMRGRTVTSLIRDMEEWHRELALDRRAQRNARYAINRKPPPEKFSSCGLDNWFYSRETKDKRTGRKIHENHVIEELLTYDRLREEGRDLHHCVTSYVWNIDRGATSIWSYSVDKEKLLTIELHNPTKTILQIRGLRNRMPTASEMSYVQRWAQKAGVLIAPRAVRRGW